MSLAEKLQRGMVQQAWVQAGECLTAGEDQVGGKFRLVDDPVIAEAAKPRLPQQRIDLPGQAVEDLAPFWWTNESASL